MSELNITSKTTKKELVEEISRLKNIIEEMKSKKAAAPRDITKGKVVSGTPKLIKEITVRCCDSDCKEPFKKDIVEYKELRKAGISAFFCEKHSNN